MNDQEGNEFSIGDQVEVVRPVSPTENFGCPDACIVGKVATVVALIPLGINIRFPGCNCRNYQDFGCCWTIFSTVPRVKKIILKATSRFRRIIV